MNSEYALDSCKSILETYLSSMIVTVESESGATYSAPAPAEFFTGEHESDIMSKFPSIQVMGKNSSTAKDEYREQERTFRFEIIAWVVEEDIEKLHRYILRYADAIIRCLRKEDYWSVNLYNPVAGEAVYSRPYKTDFGMAEGCLVTGQVSYIID